LKFPSEIFQFPEPTYLVILSAYNSLISI